MIAGDRCSSIARGLERQNQLGNHRQILQPSKALAGGSSHQPNLSSSFETRQAILQFLSPPPGEFSAISTPFCRWPRAHIAVPVRGRELDILVALIGPHDNHGSALTAQPGRSHGRPLLTRALGSSSRSVCPRTCSRVSERLPSASLVPNDALSRTVGEAMKRPQPMAEVRYAAPMVMPSCSHELATSETVARCISRFQRRSSKSVPRCIVHRLSQMTRSWTRQRCV